MSILLAILVILAVLSLSGGMWAQPRYGYWSWSPLGVILVVVVILFLVGVL